MSKGEQWDSRGAYWWVEIHPEALRANYHTLKARLPKKTACAVLVKSDGYGHGLLTAARVAAEEGAAFLAVATVEEGRRLREAGFALPILLVGPTPEWEMAEALRLNLRGFIGTLENGAAWNRHAALLGKKAKVHLKLDTGMGRFGLQADPEYLEKFVKAWKKMDHLELDGVATHFSMADVPESDFTREQARIFRLALRILEENGLHPSWIHAANSGAVVHFPDLAFNLVRLGIGWYGACPGPQPKETVPLLPAMSLKARILEIREVPAGAPVSYGATYYTERPSRLAILPVGYGCGYPRRASNRASVLIRGRRVPLLGRVTMNYTLADVTDIPEAATGDVALFFGDHGKGRLRVEEVADAAETISYEVLCQVGQCSPRIVHPLAGPNGS